MKEFIIGTITTLIFGILFFFGVMWATSAECWYACQHDSKCEGGNCHCYERFINK